MLRNPHNNLPPNSPQPGQGAASPDAEAAGFIGSPASATPARIFRHRKAAGVAGRAPAAFYPPAKVVEAIATHQHLFVKRIDATNMSNINAEMDDYVTAEWSDEVGLDEVTGELTIDVTEIDEIPLHVHGLIPHRNIKGWDGDEFHAFPFDAYREGLFALEVDGKERQIALYRIEAAD